MAHQLLDAPAGPPGPVIRVEPLTDDVRSISQLIAERSYRGDLARLAATIRALPATGTQTLVLRLATTADALALWAMHLELARRDIPPAQRWPANQESAQAEFITWLADLHWIAMRYPGHEPRFRGWRGVFTHPPASPAWHATAHRQYLFVRPRYSVAHWCAKGLALTEPQRRDLLAMPTNAMQADRRPLRPEQFAAIRERLLNHAVAHPDRSGMRTPEAIANRRARLWRVFVLAGRDHTATAKHWRNLTGETLSRQAIAKQISAVADVLRDRR